MKLLNTLLIASLSLFASHAALANTPAKAKPAQEKTQQSSNEQALKQFSESISLHFDGISARNEKNQPLIVFNYTIKNKSKKTIKEVHWATTYFSDNKPILVQDVPVTIKDNLKPKKAIPLEFAIPFSHLPDAAKAVFASEGKISAQFQAKHILFTNGSKIEVK